MLNDHVQNFGSTLLTIEHIVKIPFFYVVHDVLEILLFGAVTLTFGIFPLGMVLVHLVH